MNNKQHQISCSQGNLVLFICVYRILGHGKDLLCRIRKIKEQIIAASYDDLAVYNISAVDVQCLSGHIGGTV